MLNVKGNKIFWISGVIVAIIFVSAISLRTIFLSHYTGTPTQSNWRVYLMEDENHGVYLQLSDTSSGEEAYFNLDVDKKQAVRLATLDKNLKMLLPANIDEKYLTMDDIDGFESDVLDGEYTFVSTESTASKNSGSFNFNYNDYLAVGKDGNRFFGGVSIKTAPKKADYKFEYEYDGQEVKYLQSTSQDVLGWG